MKTINPSDLLTPAWAAGELVSQTVVQALAENPDRPVVLPSRAITGAPSAFTLACLLARTQAFPAIVICDRDLIAFHRSTLVEGLPDASVTVVDWCHPTPAEPAQITLLAEIELPRGAATLAGHNAATIAYFGRVEREPHQRRERAFRSLLDATPDPTVIVLEEWTHSEILTAAVARLAGLSDQDARRTVKLGLQAQPATPASRPTQARKSRLFAVRGLLDRSPAAAEHRAG